MNRKTVTFKESKISPNESSMVNSSEEKVAFFRKIMNIITLDRYKYRNSRPTRRLVNIARLPQKHFNVIKEDIINYPLYITATSDADFLHELMLYLQSLNLSFDDIIVKKDFRDYDTLTMDIIWEVVGKKLAGPRLSSATGKILVSGYAANYEPPSKYQPLWTTLLLLFIWMFIMLIYKIISSMMTRKY